MKPYRCPVCEGKGIVTGGFYNSIGDYGVSSSAVETCRSCEGTGIIWGKDDKVTFTYGGRLEPENYEDIDTTEPDPKFRRICIGSVAHIDYGDKAIWRFRSSVGSGDLDRDGSEFDNMDEFLEYLISEVSES